MSIFPTIRRTASGLCGLLLLLLLCACGSPPSQLDRIRDEGVLRVVTRNSPTTFYVGAEGFTGFEYDLAALFADYLEVELEILAEDDLARVLEAIYRGQADLAAAGLTITSERQKRLKFGPPYQEITQKLVYQQGETRPRDLSQLEGEFKVIANSSHVEALRQLQQDYQDLLWNETSEFSSEELLQKVLDGEIRYTIADSNELELIRPFQPELAVAFSLADPEQLAWAFVNNGDDSLYAEAIRFFGELRSSGALDELVERYYGHIDKFDYVGSRQFVRDISRKLPEYQAHFIDAAAEDLDWRLLAAMSYQESHWNPRAVSPTGVRGLMMLTQGTAKMMGVSNRMDPEQSIIGGAAYLRRVKGKIPDRISEPDRTWFALAAYNVGFGHLEDARVLAAAENANPDKWVDVKQYLPRLRQKRWYEKTRFGYARGDEPVGYVDNIRRYHDVLKRMEPEVPGAPAEETEAAEQPGEAEAEEEAAED